MQDVKPDDIPGPVEFIFTPVTSSAAIDSSAKTTFNVEATYYLMGKKKKKELIVTALPTFIELEIGRFYVAEHPASSDMQRYTSFGAEPLRVTISNALEVTNSYIKNLEVDNSVKSSSLLYIKLKTDNRKKGQEFISALISAYNSESAKDKNIVAYNTSLFINERIEQVAKELAQVEGRVESFRQEYEVTDLETQVGSYIRRGEGYENRRMEIETQLNLVRFIEDYIEDPANINDIIPNLGIADASLVQLIDQYNTLLTQRDRIEASTSAQNPAFKQINQQVSILKGNITNSISNEIKASEIALANLELEDIATRGKIDNVPTVERQFVNIEREQKVKSNLFKYLLQKREETHLTQSAISPKAKTIARPYSSHRAIAPRKSLILGVFLLIGIAVPSAALFLIDYFQTKITGTEELEKLANCKIIGHITKVHATKTNNTVGALANNTRGYLLVKPNDTSIVAEMFRTLRNNLLFMTHQREQNIILVTSTIPKEGKTFISVNLAQSLSLMEKKVLLVGADLRNPQTSHALGISKRAIGLSSYLAGKTQDYHQLIERVDSANSASATESTQAGLYTIQAGTIPPNPNELLSGNKIGQFLNQIKSEFDYIIVDSAPVGVVSDTFLIAPHTHATLYVVRENFSEKDTIPFINNIAQDKRLKNIGVVLNHTT